MCLYCLLRDNKIGKRKKNYRDCLENMTQKKRGSDSLKVGRDARATVEGCESIPVDRPVGLRVANVFHSSAQAKIMVSSGGTRGSCSNQKRFLAELQHGKPVLPQPLFVESKKVDNNTTTAKTTKARSKKKKKANESKTIVKPISNLSISTKDRIVIERGSDNFLDHRTDKSIEAKLGLRSLRVLHKFITSSSKVTMDVRHKEPILLKMFQGYGEQEREIGALIAY